MLLTTPPTPESIPAVSLTFGRHSRISSFLVYLLFKLQLFSVAYGKQIFWQSLCYPSLLQFRALEVVFLLSCLLISCCSLCGHSILLLSKSCSVSSQFFRRSSICRCRFGVSMKEVCSGSSYIAILFLSCISLVFKYDYVSFCLKIYSIIKRYLYWHVLIITNQWS